ncbi:hypothetical protein HAX54_010258, partial [Datura stramonium]|nr:hypothetical protein [Datura stramonium]
KYQKSKGEKHKQSPKIEEDEIDDEPSSTINEYGDDNDDEEANEIGRIRKRVLGFISDSHFDVDLMHRKAEVMTIITDVINNMSDEDERDNDHPQAENDEEKNEGDA